MASRLNRAHILDDVAWRLSRITAANGYPVTVVHVAREMESFDKVGRSRMPALGVFPAVGQKPDAYNVAGYRDRFLRFDVLAHVAGDDHADRTLVLSALEAAVHEELRRDPTHGGWALHSISVAGGDSDEGTPERSGKHGPSATLLTSFEAVYTPGLQNRKPMRHGSIYLDTPASQSLTADTFAAPAGTWAAGIVESGSIQTNLAAGSMAYLRERPIEFLVAVELEVECASAAVLTARLVQNGAAVARTAIGVTAAGSGARTRVSIADLLTVNENEDVAIEIASSVSQTVTVQRATFRLTPIGLV